MPAKYEKMRERFKGEGMKSADAKGKAARIYNAQRKPGQAPVTPKTRAAEKAVKRTGGSSGDAQKAMKMAAKMKAERKASPEARKAGRFGKMMKVSYGKRAGHGKRSANA